MRRCVASGLSITVRVGSKGSGQTARLILTEKLRIVDCEIFVMRLESLRDLLNKFFTKNPNHLFMRQIPTTLVIFLLLFLFHSCQSDGFVEKTNQKFGDQHFKTAISLIELHKIRTGSYPENLRDIQHTGDWDKLHLNSVKYEKLEEGYRLDLVNGWAGAPSELKYPDNFWNGLGLVESNIKEE